jgi:2-aminoadipate transaminase
VSTEPIESQITTDWDAKLAGRAAKMSSSVIRELLKITDKPDIISFAGGLPAAELFPIREFREASEYVLTTNGGKALQYGATEGYTPLREFLSEKMKKYDVPAEVENVVITNGSQQALDLVGRIFLDKGDIVVTERPTYLGALQAWRAYEPEFAPVPLDDDGMCVDQLEPVLKAHQGKVKFIYVLPNFHNPAGTTLPLDRRVELVRLAAKYGVPIIEDDPYGELRFEGEDITPIETLHKENVIYMSTFSKTLAPGIRIGWVTAPAKIIGKLVQAKQGADLHTGVFVQMVAYDICSRGLLRNHVKKVREAYHERRDAMLQAMEEFFPTGVTWTRPQGGLFLWVRVPEEINTTEFMKTALEEKVAYVPGAAFYPDDGGYNTMRLNFSYCRPEVIREGIQRLGRAIMREFG